MTITTSATATPTVRWSSSNSNVADVTAGGGVIGIAGGSTLITATIGDTIKATCMVTVRDVAVEPEVNEITSHSAILIFPKLAGASYYLIHLYERHGVVRTPVVALKVNPDGTVAIVLRSTTNTINLSLSELKAETSYEADIDVVRETNGKVEIISTLKSAFKTTKESSTAADDPTASPKRVYYSDGLLTVEGLEGYTITVYSLSGNAQSVFKSVQEIERKKLSLPDGVYVVTATNDSSRHVFKIPVR